MDDLVKRLRGYGGNRLWPHGPACDCTQAAARIEALERQVKAADALANKGSTLALQLTHIVGQEDIVVVWDEALAAYSDAREADT